MISGTCCLKKYLALALLLLFFFQGNAQQQNTSEMPEAFADSSIHKDSTKNIRVLVIPFNPLMYFSDADRDIAEVSRIGANKVASRFNGSLVENIAGHIGLYYDASALSGQKDASEDLDIVFGSIEYLPEEKEISAVGKQDRPVWQNIKEKVKSNGKSDERPEKVQYMNITLPDRRLIDFLHEKYGSDYFIFINQFEIKTDYKNCLDLQMRQYYREIKVHYTILSKESEIISGDVITLPYHSNENEIGNIVRDNFGQVSALLLSRLYLKK
jgi:hypothetical protein